MRGVAAVAVILFHFHESLGLPLFQNGYLAVDFFFVLSGFVIDAAYRAKLLAGLSVLRFTEIRLIRLYPLFLAGSLLGSIKVVGEVFFKGVAGPSPQQAAFEIALNSLMLPAPSQGQYLFAVNGPSWSLFFEIMANLLFAFAITGLRVTHLAVVAILSLAVLVGGAIGYGHLHIGWTWPTISFGLARVLFSFSLGVILSQVHERGRRRAGQQALLPIGVLAAVLFIPVTPAVQPYFDLVVVAIVFPALLWVGIHVEVPPGCLRAASFLGDISYPVYIIHFPILTIGLFATKTLATNHPTAFICAFTLGVTALAWLLSRFYDAPVRSWLSRQAGVRRSAPLQSASV